MCSPEKLVTPIVAALRLLDDRLHGAGTAPVILIDGPSGAGKSTLADALLATWPGSLVPTLVRLDDIYPGWNGLDAAAELVTEHLLRPRRDGLPAAWQRYDWAKGAPAEWHPVDPERPLVVEGCGALARANTELSDIRVWLDADDAIRKRRALTRDGETFGAHWDEWQSEWESYCATEMPEWWATIRLTAARDEVPRKAAALPEAIYRLAPFPSSPNPPARD